MPPLAVSRSDFASLQDVSQRIKAIREPVRDLMRCANISATADYAMQKSSGADKRGLLLARLTEQLEATQITLNEYLLQIPGASTHPALTRAAPFVGAQNRNRSSSINTQESATYRMARPAGLFSPDSFSSKYTAPPVPSLPASSGRASDNKRPGSASAERASALAKSPSVRSGSSANSMHKQPPPSISDAAGENSVEGSVVRLWQSDNVRTAPAKPVNDVFVKLGKRHIAPLEERIPHIPVRELSSYRNTHIGVVDLINSLLRSSAPDNEVSHLTKQIETLPPGIMACTIANSTAQLFQQLTVETVKQYAASAATTAPAAGKNPQLQIVSRTSTSSNASSGSGNSASESRSSSSSSPPASSAQSILRMLSDHANFLTRFMESTIIYPIHASQRAKRIEWWTVVACILRELGDYESLNSLICVFSTAIIGRLRSSWDLVSSKCKNAIRFILERVLKIHPNYACYRNELQARIRRMQKKKKKADSAEARAAALATMLDNNKAIDSREGKAEDESLDFDSAVAINTPDLCSSNDNWVNSGVYCKEEFDLPPPRAFVPIVAVLLKDAVSSDVSSDSASTFSDRRPSSSHVNIANNLSDMRPASSQVSSAQGTATAALHWTTVIESCYNQDLPLSLDYYMMRRIFSTEMSSLSLLMPSANQHSLTPRAFSAASNFLKRMPRRQSSTDKQNGGKELTLSHCRLLGDSAISASRAPHIVDILAHFLYISAGNPCYTCSVGSPLEKLHVSTSGQLAVVVATVLLFSEPWMPREYLTRLCDMREPRLSSSSSSTRSPNVGTLASTISAATQPSASSRMSMSSHSQGYESRSAERPWLMSFKLSDSIDYSRYNQGKHPSHGSSSNGTAKDGSDNTSGANVDSSKHSSIESARKISTDSESTCVNRAPSPNGFTNPDKDSRSGAEQIQSSLRSPAISESSRRTGHRRTSSSHSNQSTGSKNAFSPLSPNLPELPPLPNNANLPPLPSATMPRWLPSNAASGSKSPQPQPQSSSSSVRMREKSPMLVLEKLPPPPLPRQPMPRFQPEKDATSPPPQAMRSPRLTPTLPSQPMPGSMSPLKKQTDSISAEMQMLLSFDTGASGR
ncbi:Ras guanine nucleotide exchange factor bud5 [Coemansia sp. RSA 1933]|nr:Ras guanine nucleotide exchange factor bud5 [Coemansia sp. RSA 1933]